MNGFERCRREAGLTQEQAAWEMGLKSSSTVSMWETGRSMPTTKLLPRIAETYGCSIDALFPERSLLKQEQKD